MPAKKTAAKAASKPGTAVAVRPATPAPTSLIVPGSWRERARQSINTSRAVAAKMPQMSGNFLSFKGGVISAGGNEIANPLPVVVLAHRVERGWYSSPYTPGSTATPDCYSYDGDVPHEKSAVPQSETCERCRWNEFGSSSNGRGKACPKGARLAFIHADALERGQDGILQAAIWQGRISFSSAKQFTAYYEVTFGDGAATWTKLTTMTNKPNKDSQYLLSFAASVFEGEDLLDALAARCDEAEKLLAVPYPDPVETPAAKAATPPRRGRKF